MAYIFTDAERTAIQGRLNDAETGAGSYAAVYAEILASISSADMAAPDSGVDLAAWSWVKGALQVNQSLTRKVFNDIHTLQAVW